MDGIRLHETGAVERVYSVILINKIVGKQRDSNGD